MSQPAAAAGSAGAGDAAPGGGRFRGRGEKKKDAADRPFTLKIRHAKQKEVMEETRKEETYMEMADNLTNEQDLVMNRVNDTLRRFEHLTRVLKTRQRDCHSASSWFAIVLIVPFWLYAAIFVSLTIGTYRKDVN